jgi:PTS system fructose-specific IIC component
MVFGVTPQAPHGGIFVLPLIGKPLLFVVALVVGTLISTVAVILLKQLEAGTSRSVEPAVGATAVSA